MSASTNDNSLRPTALRQTPIPQRTARGNAPNSLTYAVLANEAGGKWFPSALAAGTFVNLVLFGNDTPCALTGIFEYPNDVFFGFTQLSQGGLTLPADPVPSAALAGFPADLTLVVPPSAGRDCTVALAAQNITVDGFLATLQIPTPGWDVANGGPAHTPAMRLLAGFQSGVIYGPNKFSDPATGVIYAPIILDSVSYTAAIRDAGNIIDDGAGTIGYVIGIYESNT